MNQDHHWGVKKHLRPFLYSRYDNMYVCAKSLQSCLTLCDPTDCSPPGFSVNGILQARILEWIALPPPKDLLSPCLLSPALVGGFLTTSAT